MPGVARTYEYYDCIWCAKSWWMCIF